MKTHTDEQVVELLKSYNTSLGYESMDKYFMDTFLKEKGLIEEQFKVGEWYIGEFILCYITEKEEDKHLGYGLWEGKWVDDNNSWFYDTKKQDIRLATKEEVEEALIKEAIKRGFKKGATFYDFDNDRNETIKYQSFGYGDTSNRNVLYAYTDRLKKGALGVVFLGGKWATIVEEEKKEEQQEIIITIPEGKTFTPTSIAINGETYVKK